MCVGCTSSGDHFLCVDMFYWRAQSAIDAFVVVLWAQMLSDATGLWFVVKTTNELNMYTHVAINQAPCCESQSPINVALDFSCKQ